MGGRYRKARGLGLLGCLLAARVSWAQPGTIEEIHVLGLRRMTDASFRQALGLKAGDAYDVEAVRAAFRKLWALGLFADIVIEAENAPGGGKALIVRVEERPTLASVVFEENKVLTRTQIEDRLRERGIDLALGQPLDLKRIYRAAGAIRDYLAEKGFLDAQVFHELQPVSETSYAAHFKIRPGGKTRIRRIAFTGNQVLRDKQLLEAVQLTRPRRWYWPWSRRNLYHPYRWDQDASKIRSLYHNLGYLDAEVRPPVVELLESRPKNEAKQRRRETRRQLEQERAMGKLRRRSEELEAERQRLEAAPLPEGLPPRREEKVREERRQALRKLDDRIEKLSRRLDKLGQRRAGTPRRWVQLSVAIVEGEQYRTGQMRFEGNKVFTDEQLRALVPLREGAVLNRGNLDFGVNRITRLYADRGHLYARVVQHVERRPGERIADVAIEIVEDRPYTVERIQFAGNTKTQDRVLRREMQVNETELFSRTKLDQSLVKLNQLGYFEVKEDPAIEPVEDRDAVGITVVGEERGRNEVQVGGGFSGVDGAFFQGFYSTRNFLGRGQVLTVSLQVGGRRNVYSLSFLEPWFLARPIQLGANIFRQDLDFGTNLRSRSQGGGLVVGRRLGVFSRVQLNYNYESFTQTGFTLTGIEARNRISSLTPAYVYNKVDNPFRPRRGWSVEAQSQFAGGFLGGDTNFVKPVVRYTYYRPLHRRWYLGFHAQGGQVRAFQGGAPSSAATVEGIPRSLRFWLGGDIFGPRVFQTRSVTPLRFVELDPQGRIVRTVKDPTGEPVSRFDVNRDGVLDRADLVQLGGDRFYLFQTELIYPISEQLDLVGFLDMGSALFEDTSWGFDEARVSAGVEVRFHLPVFPVPLRLIYGVPLRKVQEDRTENFTFSIGRSF